MLDVLTLIPASAEATDVETLLAFLVPSISQAPGLRSLRISDGDVMHRGGPSPYSHVFEFTFDSLAEWMTWVLAPERQQRAAGNPFDRVNPTILYFETADPRAANA